LSSAIAGTPSFPEYGIIKVMSQERPQPNDEGFGFTEQERLFDRVTDERFRALIEDERTTIHKVELSSNSYGEFLFVTASRPAGESRAVAVFWGYGFHDYRERWLKDEWFWYESPAYSDTMEQTLSREEAQERLKQRLEEIAPYLGDQQQTERARIFEMLADLSDEDGALADLEEMEDWLDSLDDL
jgi:hypothetical protein